ncbi:hypothetical protein EF384_05300, partial [Aerococcus agrisoli]
MGVERIKYYGPEDLTYSSYLKDSEEFAKNFNMKLEELNLDDLIEIYNVLKYLSKTSFRINECIDFKNTANKLIRTYIFKKDFKQLGMEYKTLYVSYKEDFWEIIVNYRLTDKISETELVSFINDNEVFILDLLKQKVIVDKFSGIIKPILLNEPKYFEFFITKYTSINDVDYVFPKNISDVEINGWADKYCDSTDANPNYLQQIVEWSTKQNKKINDQVRLKAKKVRDNQMEENFDLSTGFNTYYDIRFVPNLAEHIKMETIDSTHLKIYFDKTWLDDETDTAVKDSIKL